jgi:hypothetical protein
VDGPSLTRAMDEIEHEAKKPAPDGGKLKGLLSGARGVRVGAARNLTAEERWHCYLKPSNAQLIAIIVFIGSHSQAGINSLSGRGRAPSICPDRTRHRLDCDQLAIVAVLDFFPEHHQSGAPA